MKAELIAHFCLTYPAYRTARPGMLCRPTNVAAASCHALLPLSSHLGDGTSITCSLSFLPWRSSQYFLPPTQAECGRGIPLWRQAACHLHFAVKSHPQI